MPLIRAADAVIFSRRAEAFMLLSDAADMPEAHMLLRYDMPLCLRLLLRHAMLLFATRHYYTPYVFALRQRRY